MPDKMHVTVKHFMGVGGTGLGMEGQGGGGGTRKRGAGW